MKKNILLLTALISMAESSNAREIQLRIGESDKEMIILAARPEEKLFLKNYLSTISISEEDAFKAQGILKRILREIESNNPMVTFQFDGE